MRRWCPRLLALRGHEIVILQRPVVDLGSVVALPDHIEVEVSSLRRLPGEVRRVARLCRERRIDVIHTHTSSAMRSGRCCGCSTACRASRPRTA